MKKIITLVCVIVALALLTGNAGAGFSDGGDRPATQGGIRVIHNGDWVYFQELAEGSATVDITGQYTCQKMTNYMHCTVTFPGAAGNWIDVNANAQ